LVWLHWTGPSGEFFLEQFLPELVHPSGDLLLGDLLLLELELELDALVLHPPLPLMLEDGLVRLPLSTQMVVVSLVGLRAIVVWGPRLR
jgi:hypothetical protein